MGCIKKTSIFYLKKLSHGAAQEKKENLKNTTTVKGYQLLTTLVYVLDSSDRRYMSVVVFSEHSKSS